MQATTVSLLLNFHNWFLWISLFLSLSCPAPLCFYVAGTQVDILTFIVFLFELLGRDIFPIYWSFRFFPFFLSLFSVSFGTVDVVKIIGQLCIVVRFDGVMGQQDFGVHISFGRFELWNFLHSKRSRFMTSVGDSCWHLPCKMMLSCNSHTGIAELCCSSSCA